MISPGANGLTMTPIFRPPMQAISAARTCPASFCLGVSWKTSSIAPVAKMTVKESASMG